MSEYRYQTPTIQPVPPFNEEVVCIDPESGQYRAPPYGYDLPRWGTRLPVERPDGIQEPSEIRKADSTTHRKSRHKRVKPGPTTDKQLQKEFIKKRIRIGESLQPSLQEARDQGRSEWSHSDPTRTIEVFLNVSLEQLLSGTDGDEPTPVEQALEDAKSYKRIDDDKAYIALDRDLKVLVARFPDAYNQVWGNIFGKELVKQTAEDIAKGILFLQPTAPRDDPRHTRYKEWIEDERHLVFTDGPWARCGQIHLGLQKDPESYMIVETEHEMGRWPVKGLLKGRQCASSNIIEFLRNTSKTIDLIFEATDPDFYTQYNECYSGMSSLAYLSWRNSGRGTFSRRTLAINLLTEPHKDTEYWKGGWAWHTVFGEYTGGDFCISLLKRKFAFRPGCVFGIRGAQLEHFTEEWFGNCRYGLVHTTDEAVRVAVAEEKLRRETRVRERRERRGGRSNV
ncbi:hypothetical protein EDC01DRAFT_369463 [Geopyxis carbonaria]|nr:hypothetical protein EDC01DRAFT_369463 [Geopyxis carbonaria]